MDRNFQGRIWSRSNPNPKPNQKQEGQKMNGKNQSATLKRVSKQELLDAITVINGFKAGPRIKVDEKASKADLAKALVDKVLKMADRGMKIPEEIDILVGKLTGAPDPIPQPEPKPPVEPEPEPKATKSKKDKVAPAPVNGIRPPKPESLCGKAWAVADAVMKRKKEAPSLKEVLESSEAEGLNRGNLMTEFYRWRKFNGIARQVEA